MTSAIGFSDAPAPMALGDLEGEASSEAAPAPTDLGSLGSITGDAPAPMDLEGGAGAIGQPGPAPVDIGAMESAGTESAAPTPVGGPGDVAAGTVQGEVGGADTAPVPMDLSALEAMEPG